MSQQQILSGYAVTQTQVHTLLSILSQLDRPWTGMLSGDGDTVGGAMDGGVKSAMEATAIKTCEALDRLLADPNRWTLARIDKIEDSLCGYYEAQRKSVEAQINPRPCALLRPNLFYTSGLWFAVYGEVVENRLVGVGETPEEALAEFDKHYTDSKPNSRLNNNENK